MIRFAWLQFRMQAALTAAALTIVAVVLALTGSELAHLYDTTSNPGRRPGLGLRAWPM